MAEMSPMNEPSKVLDDNLMALNQCRGDPGPSMNILSAGDCKEVFSQIARAIYCTP